MKPSRLETWENSVDMEGSGAWFRCRHDELEDMEVGIPLGIWLEG